jgi:serine/threonine protein kinase
VKSYRRRPDDERSYKVRIMREAETLGLFNHPHIVHLRYFSRTSDFWLLYLENVGSTTLSQYIAQHGRLSRAAKSPYCIWDASNWEDTTRKFARQIGSALRYCHLNCIHHYNLHSGKIMVTSKGNIKLTGFGKMQLVSIVEDETFDTFSYGTIIWQMICGFTPWPVNENWDEYLRNTSTLVTNPGYISTGKILEPGSYSP